MPDYIYYIDSNMTDGGCTSGRVQLHSAEILSEGGLGAVVTQNVTLPYRGVGAALQATTGGILAIPGYVPGSSATTGPVYYITPTGSSLRATQGAFSLPQPLGRASVCSYSGGRYAFVAGGEQDTDYSSKLYRITLTDSARPSAVSLIGELPVPPGGMSAPNLIFVHNSKLWVLLNTPNGADLFAHGLTATGTLNTFGWKQIGTIRGYYPFRKSDQGIGFSPDGTFIFIAAASAAGTNVILRGKLCGDTILEWWPIEPYGLSDATSIPFLTMQDNTMYCLAQKGGTWAWHNAWIPTTGPSTESPNLFSTGITFNYYMDSPGGAANRVTLGKTFPENYRAISTTELHPELSGNQVKPTFYLNPQPATLAREMGSVFGYVTDDSGAVTLYGSIDSGPYITQGFDMPNDSAWEWVVPALSEGQHNIKIRAVDTAGNFSEQQYQVLLDQTPPDLTLSSSSSSPSAVIGRVEDVTSGIKKITWGSDTAGFPATFSTYYEYNPLTPPPPTSVDFYLPTYYGTQEHYVTVIAEDLVGNTLNYSRVKNADDAGGGVELASGIPKGITPTTRYGRITDGLLVTPDPDSVEYAEEGYDGGLTYGRFHFRFDLGKELIVRTRLNDDNETVPPLFGDEYSKILVPQDCYIYPGTSDTDYNSELEDDNPFNIINTEESALVVHLGATLIDIINMYTATYEVVYTNMYLITSFKTLEGYWREVFTTLDPEATTRIFPSVTRLNAGSEYGTYCVFPLSSLGIYQLGNVIQGFVGILLTRTTAYPEPFYLRGSYYDNTYTPLPIVTRLQQDTAEDGGYRAYFLTDSVSNRLYTPTLDSPGVTGGGVSTYTMGGSDGYVYSNGGDWVTIGTGNSLMDPDPAEFLLTSAPSLEFWATFGNYIPLGYVTDEYLPFFEYSERYGRDWWVSIRPNGVDHWTVVSTLSGFTYSISRESYTTDTNPQVIGIYFNITDPRASLTESEVFTGWSCVNGVTGSAIHLSLDISNYWSNCWIGDPDDSYPPLDHTYRWPNTNIGKEDPLTIWNLRMNVFSTDEGLWDNPTGPEPTGPGPTGPGPWTGSTGDTYQTGPLSYSDGILKDLELYSTYEIS